MHKSNLDKKDHQEVIKDERLSKIEKDLKKISERKKLQNMVFEKMIKDLKEK